MTSWDAITAAIGQAVAGEKDHARTALTTCWQHTGDEETAKRCVIAHYLADLQPHLDDEVAWDERALAAYLHVTDQDLAPVGITSARGLAPSLHLNLGDGYLRQGRVADAQAQLEAGREAQHVLPEDGYGVLIRRGLAALGDRIDECRNPQPR